MSASFAGCNDSGFHANVLDSASAIMLNLTINDKRQSCLVACTVLHLKISLLKNDALEKHASKSINHAGSRQIRIECAKYECGENGDVLASRQDISLKVVQKAQASVK